jgi:hypothetical protein
VVRTVRQKLKRILKRREVKPSEYLAKHFGIALPSNIAEFWDRAAYVEESGAIFFESAEPEIVEGYWEVGREPFFDRELEKYLSWYLFDNNPNIFIHACEPGTVCVVDDEGRAYLEFEVYERGEGKIHFAGAVGGHSRVKEVDGTSYVEFVPEYIVLKPLSRY